MTRTGAEARPPLDEGKESIVDWLRVNAKMLTIGVAVVAVVASGAAMYRSFERTKEDRANAALSQVRQTYAAGNLALAQSDLKKLVERYKGTEAATEGSLLLAQALYDDGKTADGLKVLEGVSTGGQNGAAVLAMKAAGLEQEQKFAEAAEEYLNASGKAHSTPERLDYTAEAARAYAAAGKKAEAEKLWQKLRDSDDPSLAAEARLRLGELTATAAKG